MRSVSLVLVVLVGTLHAQSGGTGSLANDRLVSELDPCWEIFEKKDYAACATCLTKAERRNPRPTDPERCDRLALNGNLALVNGDPSKAKDILTEALVLFQRGGGDPRSGKRIHRWLGRIYYEEGDYHKALELYRGQAALEHGRAEPRPGSLAGVEYNIGNCFWGMDLRDSCKVHYGRALKEWRKEDTLRNPMFSYIYEVLGTYAWDEGDERAALAYFDLSAAHHLRNANGTDAADGLVADARANETSGNKEQALQLYQRALEFRIAQYGATNPNSVCMHTDIAHMLASMGRDREALERAQEAIGLFMPSFRPVDIYANPASTDSASSQRLLLDALLLKFRILKEDSTSMVARVSADAVIDLSLQAIERLRTGAEAEGSKLFWSDHVRGFIEDALDHCQRRFVPGDTAMIARVLTLMEAGRNALLAEALRSLDARELTGLPDSVARAEGELKQRIADLRRYIALEQKKCERMDADKVGLWKKAVAGGEADLTRLVARIARSYPAYHELRYAASRIDPAGVQRRLGTDRSLLCMYLGREALYLFLIDDRGARFVRDERVAEIVAAAGALRDQLRDRAPSMADPQGAYDAFIANAAFLHEAVFGQFTPAPHTHLAILPDGAFHYLPFDALLVERPQATERDYGSLHYVIKDHAVQVITMIGPWLRQRGSNTTHGLNYLGVAPSYDSGDGRGLLPLRSTAGEVSAAHGLLGGETFMGDDANEGGFKQRASDAAVLHLAMHTVMDEARPNETALAFGRADGTDDGSLHMHELYGMDLNAQLAMLSACSTGDGPMLRGEGIASMARAFAYTGCPAIVMNLWSCDDGTSSAIITSFCEGVKNGDALDDALREAKLQYLSTADPSRSHPFYWSTLALLGDERPIELSQPWYREPWTWAIAGAAVLLVFFRLRSAKNA